MSVLVPLAVRLVTSRTDKYVTRELRSLRFRSIVPGGFASATFSLDRPINIQPEEIAYYGKVYVYDARSGETVWEGRLEDPGRGVSDAGLVWELTAIGPSAHTRDRKIPLIYVDRDLNKWQRTDNFTPGGTNSVTDEASTGEMGLLMQWPQGLGVVNNSRVVLRYWHLMYTGQKVARYEYNWDAGLTDVTHAVQGITRTDGSLGSGENNRNDTFNTAGGSSGALEIVTNWPSGRNTVEVRIFRVSGGAATIPNDTYWAIVTDLVIVATRYNKSGSELLTAGDYSASTVLSSEIVADLLGRLLTEYNGAEASIATTSYAIEQLAYPDGVDAATVLDDLMRFDAGYYWAAWESNSAGLHRFEWAAWPTTVRYSADTTDGFNSPGSADGLYNAVRVRWKDIAGNVRTNRRTATVAALDNAGLTREGLIDLGDDVGTSANADRAGDQWLAERSTPPNAGRLTIARPIYDATAGRMVQPWEIRPGNLIRVRGVLPRPDALNASTRDGVTVFRIVSTEFDSGSASAVLELDSYSVSTARAIADTQRKLMSVVSSGSVIRRR